MANRHFAKLADVWKHLPLVEILSIERPRAYWETHAGNATYELVENPERRYGALGFLEAAAKSSALSRSRYVAHLRSLASPEERLTTYPGSPMLAMLELGADCSYLFCDLDPGSVANLEASAEGLGLASQVRVAASDGMAALHQAALALDTEQKVLAHVDPYDPFAPGASGLSALDVARELIERRVGVMYWYGYDRPASRAWAFDQLSRRPADRHVWCGDIMVASEGALPTDGDLGDATTAGTGFGVVCANLSTETIAACERLGEELAAVYDGIPLPDGSPGHLEFTTRADADAA